MWKREEIQKMSREVKGGEYKIHYPKSVAVYNNNGVVWMKPIKIPFARFYRMENYHVADYNLYWINIRNNLRSRLKENGHN